jgi:diphthamide biosynthesis methyltransferase
MKTSKVLERIRDLRLLKQVYGRLYTDQYTSLFSNSDLKRLIKMTDEELHKLLNMLDDGTAGVSCEQ